MDDFTTWLENPYLRPLAQSDIGACLAQAAQAAKVQEQHVRGASSAPTPATTAESEGGERTDHDQEHEA